MSLSFFANVPCTAFFGGNFSYRRVKKDSFTGGTRYKERLVILRSYDTMGEGAMVRMPDCARTGIGGMSMWLAEVKAKAGRRNQILFGSESLLLVELRELVAGTNRRALILWALELAEETVRELESRYPGDHRPQEAVEVARAWAAGEIKMPLAKRAILDCHAMAKELTAPADIARCHAVGLACSVVHTRSHAMGYPIYELTALVRELGLENCREAVEARVRDYEQQLRLWTEREQTDCRDWAAFLRE